MIAKELAGIPVSTGPGAFFGRLISKVFTPGWEKYDSVYDTIQSKLWRSLKTTL